MRYFFLFDTNTGERKYAMISTHGYYELYDTFDRRDGEGLRQGDQCQAGWTDELGMVYSIHNDWLWTDPHELKKEEVERRLAEVCGASEEVRLSLIERYQLQLQENPPSVDAIVLDFNDNTIERKMVGPLDAPPENAQTPLHDTPPDQPQTREDFLKELLGKEE